MAGQSHGGQDERPRGPYGHGITLLLGGRVTNPVTPPSSHRHSVSRFYLQPKVARSPSWVRARCIAEGRNAKQVSSRYTTCSPEIGRPVSQYAGLSRVAPGVLAPSLMHRRRVMEDSDAIRPVIPI